MLGKMIFSSILMFVHRWQHDKLKKKKKKKNLSRGKLATRFNRLNEASTTATVVVSKRASSVSAVIYMIDTFTYVTGTYREVGKESISSKTLRQ